MTGAAAFAAATLAFSGAANAQQAGLAPAQSSSRQVSAPLGLLSQPQSSGARRYSTPDGAVRFVLDRSGGRVALVRFEGDPEVHVLRPVMAARGDEIYRTESGDLQLRVTPHGGVIVYTSAMRTGSPASEEAMVAPLAPQAITLAALPARLRELQIRAAREGRPVEFDVHLEDPSGAGVALDAAERAVAALPPSAVVRRIGINVGVAPRAQMRGDYLTIQVTPRLGYAGRPSSMMIRDAVSGAPQGPER